MDQTADALAGLHQSGPRQLKGGARGALVCAWFGSGWMYWAVVLSRHLSPVWFSTVTLPATALIVLAILRLRAVRHLTSPPLGKFFWAVVGAEWGSVVAAAFLLGRFGHADLIPQAAGLAVGLHFLPLARLFQAPLLRWTGSIMTAGAVGTLLMPHGALRDTAACVTVGLTLWGTCAVILFRISPEYKG